MSWSHHSTRVATQRNGCILSIFDGANSCKSARREQHRPRPMGRIWQTMVATLFAISSCTSESASPNQSPGAGQSTSSSKGNSFSPLSTTPPPCGPSVRPFAERTTLSQQWAEEYPANDATYDLRGVTSTAYPATQSPFAIGTKSPGLRTCVVGGTVLGQADDEKTWSYYHDKFNASCVRIAALEWMQVRDLRCDNVEDGIKPAESEVNANNATFFVSGTYLTRIRDDCLENDFTVGGILHDNLWEECNTGISERPAGDRSWATPVDEYLVLDHMLIGLYETPHNEEGSTVMGENFVVQVVPTGNRLVIRCSVFKVNSVSLNGVDAMAVPAGTVIDDTACPDKPSTIVWLGGGAYPASTGGMRVVTDVAVWDAAVKAWKAAHNR